MWQCMKLLKTKQQNSINSDQWFEYFSGLLSNNSFNIYTDFAMYIESFVNNPVNNLKIEESVNNTLNWGIIIKQFLF